MSSDAHAEQKQKDQFEDSTTWDDFRTIYGQYRDNVERKSKQRTREESTRKDDGDGDGFFYKLQKFVQRYGYRPSSAQYFPLFVLFLVIFGAGSSVFNVSYVFLMHR